MPEDTIMSSCLDCPIRHNAVCANCDASELAILENAKSYKTFPAGARLADTGEDMAYLSSIVSGCAAMSKTFEDGRRQTVGLLLPSDFLGRPGRAVSLFDVEALTETTVCRFERNSFEALVERTPHIASRLMKMTLDELDAARERAVVLGRMTAREKLAAFLVSLARRDARASGQPLPSGRVALTLPLTREAIADYLGLTIETTSRQMTALRKDALIETPSARHIDMPDFERLLHEAGSDEISSAL